MRKQLISVENIYALTIWSFALLFPIIDTGQIGVSWIILTVLALKYTDNVRGKAVYRLSIVPVLFIGAVAVVDMFFLDRLLIVSGIMFSVAASGTGVWISWLMVSDTRVTNRIMCGMYLLFAFVMLPFEPSLSFFEQRILICFLVTTLIAIQTYSTGENS